MAPELICETCGLTVPPDTSVCPRDGTVVLASFRVPAPARAVEPTVVVHEGSMPAPGADEPLRDPLIGLKLGEYELRSRIGVGGMGLVYEGIQPLIGKRVAVKVLRPELAHSTEQVERLLAEARAVNAIRHRGIIDIFGFGQVPDGRQYIIMEFLDGQPLDAVLTEKSRLPVNEALAILDEVLAALASAHGAGVVHRDLKPSNIFLVHQPDGSRFVKLLDFGLAKRGQGPTGRTAQTRTDMVVGTPEYMAPEQARGQEVGAMTDLYAMGVVTFEMVTGRLPFIGSSPVDLLMKHVEARPPRPSEYAPELPPALDAFILQMLTKDPEVRPNSADALRKQLQKLRRTLRPTQSNSNALAPSEARRTPSSDPVDPRRPTIPVPLPLELTAPEAVTGRVATPPRSVLPMAATAVAVMLISGATAVILGRASSGSTVSSVSLQPANSASAGNGTGQTAPGNSAAPGSDTLQAPSGASQTAQGTPPSAGTPTQVANPTGGGTPAAVAGTTASQGTVQPVNTASGGATGTVPVTGAVQGSSAASTTQPVGAAAGGATGTVQGSGTASGSTVAGTTQPEGAAVATTRAPPAAGKGVPTQRTLLRRIEKLEEALDREIAAGASIDRSAAKLLENYKGRAEDAQSASARRDIDVALDLWQKNVLKDKAH